MKNCKYRDKVINYIDGQLNYQEAYDFESHLKTCGSCQKEIIEFKRVYEILDNDEVPVPEQGFFDKLRIRIRMKEIILKPSPVWQITRIAAPVLAVLVVVFLIFNKPRGTIEITVPISSLLQNEDFNNLLLDRIIDDKVVTHFTTLEDYFTPNIEEYLNEFSEDEKVEFIKIITEKFRNLGV